MSYDVLRFSSKPHEMSYLSQTKLNVHCLEYGRVPVRVDVIGAG
jgi:hypothetical protein